MTINCLTRRQELRVLMLAPTSFFADYGCHVRILEESLALQKRGVKMVVCTYNQGRDVPGVATHRSVRIPWLRSVHIGSSGHKFYLDPLLTAKALQVAAWYRPHVIHAHLHEGALIGYPLSQLLRIPLVFDFQGSLTSEMVDHGFLRPNSWAYAPLRRLEGLISRKADAIITSTRHASNLLVETFGCRPERIYPVPDGVNLETFRPRWLVEPQQRAKRLAELGIPRERQVVVYLGLLAEYQGSSHLLYAAARLLPDRPQTHFLLMGYPGQHRYQGMASALRIDGNVSFTGRVPYDRAPAYLALGDVAVSPKISATEGNGKLLNYMAIGLPTVAFDSTVNREILDSFGTYAQFADADDLARAMSSLLTDSSEAEARGRALRQRAVEHFSWQKGGQEILSIYESLT